MSPALDVASIARDLIRIDTSNSGDDSGPGEREATEYVAGFLSDLGLEPVIRESAPRRTNLTALWEGADRSRPPLVLHGHLDVVPADPDGWSHPPFAAEIHEGLIWGRGAVDMKATDAMYLAAVARMIHDGVKPARDVVLAFFADEENGGARGSRFMVDNHPDDFREATEAISEVGGFSSVVDGKRAYLIQTAEKGLLWLRLTAVGTAGHGSLVHGDNAITRLAEALARIGRHSWPVQLSPTVEALLRGVADLAGEEFSPEPDVVDHLVSRLGCAARFIDPTVRNTANTTRLKAGCQSNVIPDRAEAVIDLRFVPGQKEGALATIEELAGPGVSVDIIRTDIALEQPFDTPLVHKMTEALNTEDPGSAVLPYALSGGTDNKHLSRLGIVGYGFAPLRLPEGFDFPSQFHAVDERIPVDALEFGMRVTERFLRNC
ncbi:MAG: M20/M25/M40 family metallo-hydrolase [Demequinaceae bacterium]|nr:M20/M25/M40 family metallo-hydrolase [Demequinaceae bacterium]